MNGHRIDGHCVSWDDQRETTSPNGVGKRSLAGEDAGLVRITIPAGTKAGRHSHPHEQFVQVLEGSGILETDRGRVAFGPGSVFHFPAEVWHAAEFETDTVLVEVNLTPSSHSRFA